MPKKIVEAKVIGQHVLNNSTKLIEVYAPELAELAVPGQFVNVQVFVFISSLTVLRRFCAVLLVLLPLIKKKAPLP